MNPNEQLMNLRLTLVIKGTESGKSLDEIKELYEFVKGPSQSILPVSNFQVVPN